MSDLTVRTPLAQQVASELVRRIVADEYAEGEMIPPESELAEQLVVGRSTIREAMKVLVGAGLVEIRRGRGTCVRSRDEWSPFDPIVLAARAGLPGGAHETTLKVLEARQLVEVGVAELAASRATPEHIERLDRFIAEMESAADVDAFVTADLAFHNTLLEAADNPFVSTLFAPIDALLSEERRRTSEPPSLRPAAIAAHRAIAEAVRRRDPVAARTEMTEHLRQTGQKMEALWAEAGDT
jgi:GntR family transcriptional regulator, transcriptional repressor for pyruvate dehydrogenase complex